MNCEYIWDIMSDYCRFQSSDFNICRHASNDSITVECTFENCPLFK
jgi:hypothetical protein